MDGRHGPEVALHDMDIVIGQRGHRQQIDAHGLASIPDSSDDVLQP